MTKNRLAAQAWITNFTKKTDLLTQKTRFTLLFLVLGFMILVVPSSGIAQNLNLPKISAHRQNPPQLSPPPPVPIRNEDAAPPNINAKGAIVIDAQSSTVLFEQNPDQELLPASTTKIMTALVALDAYSLDDIITIDQEEHTIGHTMNLIKGEQITVENLLYGMLVSSGNDAALALALSYPRGGYTGFIADMNRKAADLNLTKTTYKNVSGVESRGHLTTPRNLAALANIALKNPVFKQIVATQKISIQSIDNKYTHDLDTTNYLLGRIDGVVGVKTGWTENALECLVTAVDRDNHQIIIVVLGSNDRFGNTQKIIDWVYQNHTWQEPVVFSN